MFSLDEKKAAVVGGGIAGLACAHQLVEQAKQAGVRLCVAVYEGATRLGGNIETVERGGFLLENGPDSFLTEKPDALELSERLGLGDRIIGTRPESRRVFVARRGRLVELPAGFYLVAPSDIGAFWSTPLFSAAGKMRAMLDVVLPRGRKDDESIGGFIERRLGREILQTAGQPMLAGIHAGDPYRLSLQAVMPRFAELENRHRSLVLGLMASARQNAALRKAQGPRSTLFASYDKGMGTLVRALERDLGRSGVHIYLGDRISELSRTADERWRLLSTAGYETYDVVCLAGSAARSAVLLADASPELSSLLGSIEYESVATLHFAWHRRDIGHPLNGAGFVVPAAEGSPLLACTFSSVKFDGRAPEGAVLVRAFAGGALGRRFLEYPDIELSRRVCEALKKFLGIANEPFLSDVRRHQSRMPQYTVGHLKKMDRIREEAARLPGLEIAGSSYEGAGISDCVRQGKRAALRMKEHLFGTKAGSPVAA